MYIIPCRAHFSHLLGLGQVGHFPRGTSGSAGTLDWGPMWLASQSNCHPQYFPDTPLTASHHPYTPRSPMPLMPPILLLAPEYLVPASSPYNPDTPYTLTSPESPWYPIMASNTLHPLAAPNTPDAPIFLLASEYLESLPAPNTSLHPWWPLMASTPPRNPQMSPIPFWPWVPTVPASPSVHPWDPLHPCFPLMVHNTPVGPKCPLCHLYPFLAFEYLHPLPAPQDILYTHWHPLMAPTTTRNSQMPPYVTYTPSCPWVPTLPGSPIHPWHPLHPWCPPDGLQHPVATQYWKTNKEVWTGKDDWPPWRTSTYERPFNWEGNYVVIFCHHCTMSVFTHKLPFFTSQCLISEVQEEK